MSYAKTVTGALLRVGSEAQGGLRAKHTHYYARDLLKVSLTIVVGPVVLGEQCAVGFSSVDARQLFSDFCIIWL